MDGLGRPAGWTEAYRCGGPQNHKGYCNRSATRWLLRADSTIDGRRRAALLSKVDEQMASDLSAIPLYQKPTYTVYKSKVRGIRDNPTRESFTWNSKDWWLADED